MLRVAFFGGAGAFSAAHLTALIAAHRVVGVFCGLESAGVRGAVGRALRLAGVRSDPCTRVAFAHGIPVWFTTPTTALRARVASLAPDVICAAGYPWLLPRDVWQMPPLGALNSHASLLPRHRGVLPLFWIYFHDDKTTGVTIHRLTERADAGPIVCQDAYPLPRGFPVERLNEMNAARGSQLLNDALGKVSAGEPGVPQVEAHSTRAPRVARGSAMVEASWDVERVWHFLTGLYPRFIEPLQDSEGRRVEYGGRLSYQRIEHAHSPRTVRRESGGWRLYCHGGVVMLPARDASGH